jgi:hypothetical protein
VNTQQVFQELVEWLAENHPEVRGQWDVIVKDVHKLLRLFTSDVIEKSD